MKIAVVGSGYVGLVSGTCYAESGNEVVCVDIDKERIAQLCEGKTPIYEPGLEELVRRNLKEGRLRFTTDIADAIKNSMVSYIAVGTPMSASGAADLTAIFRAAEDIAKSITGDPAALRFTINGVAFKPFYESYGRYSVYLNVALK